MRKIREVLRLKFDCGLSVRKISRSLGIGHSSAGDYLCRFAASGLAWPCSLSDSELEQQLFPLAPAVPSEQRPLPDWSWVHAELRRPGVTLALLWQEYRLSQPQGFQYSWFCEHYRAWQGKLDVVMRQEHRVGEKLFVDYAGQTVPVIDRHSGEIRQAQVFVAVLGASSYTFAEATWSQQLPDWLGSHARCFAFLGGVPEIVVPDNLRSAVSKAHRYEPDINPSYRDLAEHYGVAVVPARARKPRDKAKAEVGVQVVERWILAALRNRQFFSLDELNTAIAALLDRLNRRAFRKLPGSRHSAFEALDRPALRPLPEQPYVYAEWKKARVHILCGLAISVAFSPRHGLGCGVARSVGHRSIKATESNMSLPSIAEGGSTHVRSAIQARSRDRASHHITALSRATSLFGASARPWGRA